MKVGLDTTVSPGHEQGHFGNHLVWHKPLEITQSNSLLKAGSAGDIFPACHQLGFQSAENPRLYFTTYCRSVFSCSERVPSNLCPSLIARGATKINRSSFPPIRDQQAIPLGQHSKGEVFGPKTSHLNAQFGLKQYQLFCCTAVPQRLLFQLEQNMRTSTLLDRMMDCLL